MSQCQRKENTVPLFAPPVVRLDQDTSLRQPLYVPARSARPRAHRLGWRRRGEDGEGSSTESQADLHNMPPGYVDHVVDAQYPEYVVIEASPRETGEEVGRLDMFRPVSVPLCCRCFPPHLLCPHQQRLQQRHITHTLLVTTYPSPVPCS